MAERDVGQSASKRRGEARPIGVVADAPPVAQPPIAGNGLPPARKGRIKQSLVSWCYLKHFANSPEKLAEAKAAGKQLPSNHSPLFAPVAEPSIKTGMTAEVTILRDLLKGTPADVKKFTTPAAGN